MARRALIHEIEASERRGRWFPAFAGLLAIAMLAATWVGLFSFMGSNAAYGTFSDLQTEFIPDVDAMELSFPDLSLVSRVYAAGGEPLAELHDGRISRPTPIDEIPQLVIDAILAAEDAEFYEHEGVDFQAIASAAIDNILYDSTRGGSTITQQLTKQLFVGDDVTIRRKISEAFVAAELERRFDKDQILEFYLNSVFFGSNAYGVAAAADEYFDKTLDEVTLTEAATLAVLVRNPTFYNPRTRPAEVRDRRDKVIDEMLEQGWISDASARNAKRQPLDVLPKSVFRSPAEHVVAEVKRQLLNDPEFSVLGETHDERKKAIFGCAADDTACTGGGGLRIETTLDLPAQLQANDILARWFPLLPLEENLAACQRIFPQDAANNPDFIAALAESESCAPTGAIATVDADTGAIVVMASGLPFEEEQFDLAIQGRRNPGSSMKPIALVTALENGISLGQHFNGASPVELQCPYVCDPERGNIWRVSNAGNANYGSITLETATYKSVNTVYAALSLKVGPEKIVDMAHRMGITSTLDAVPSLALGTSAVSPLEMASAYTNFATNGLHAEPFLISRIFNSRGELIYEHDVVRAQVAAPEIFAAARQPLRKVPTGEGTAPRANIGRPQGGKTGTHQSYLDAFFVGFVPQYATAVWTGYARQQVPLERVTINGNYYERVFGGSVPAPIWKEFMDQFLADVPVEEFLELPEESLEKYFEVPVTTMPSVVGLDVETATANLQAAGLTARAISIPSLEPPGTVTGQSYAAGAQVPLGSNVYLNVSNGEVPSATLPNVVGMTFEQASEELKNLGPNTGLQFFVDRRDTPGAAGIVISMSPGPGANIGWGTLVTLYVGTG